MNNTSILRSVKWKDLKELSAYEMLIENNLTLPWLFLSLTLAYFQIYWLAFVAEFLFFLAALRQVHNGFHNALGTNKKLTWFTLFSNSVLMMASIHAVKFNHLRHHKYCLGEGDYEGVSASMKWYKAMLYGPVHIFMIHKMTWQLGNKMYKRNMLLELFAIVLFTLFVCYFNIRFLMFHIAVMLLAESLSAFFAVWTVHHDLEEGNIARTQRKGWKNFVTMNMFYHLEHHMFPAVPTIKLPELARRIDTACPEMTKRSTF
jgi:fatty acid desaturase